jgi:protease-4
LNKIGVKVEIYKTAPRADAEALYRPFTDDERKELQRKVQQFYNVFLSRVAQGRKSTVEAIDKVGQGRVWTGRQALDRKLVDEIGGLRQALAYARRMADLPDNARIEEFPKIETTLLGKLLGIEGIKAESDPFAGLSVVAQLKQFVQALGPFAVHPSDKPLARMEFVPLDP